MSKDNNKKERLILENFSRVFNKIKRVNESDINEIDYQAMYHKMDDVGTQRDKINGLPTPDPQLIDNWIKNISKDPSGSWPLDAVKAVKAIYDKHKNGEQLNPDEIKLLRYRNKNKEYQNQRIKSRAGDVLKQKYVAQSTASLPQYQNQTLVGKSNGKPTQLSVVDAGKLVLDKDSSFAFTFKVKVGEYLSNLKVFPDGSYGFYDTKGKPISDVFRLDDYSIIKDVTQILHQAKSEFHQ